MAINKKLLHFNEYQNFNSKKLSANSDNTQYTLGISDQIYNGEDLDIKYQSIVFIKDTKQIWTHGQLYNSQNIDLSDYLTEEQIRALIPTKLGELINDVGYITEANIDESIYQEIYNQIVNTADLENYYTKEQVDNIVENITIDSDNIDLSDYYTKDEVDELIEGIPGSDSDLTDYVKHEVFDPFKNATEKSISTLQTDKQDLLISGVNIKTINNESLLGEGNITINGGSGGVEIIRTTDVTKPTDSNVYSAARTDQDFTNRDKNETVDGAWSFNNNIIFDKAIQSKEYGISNILGYGWFLGYNHFDDDGKGTNSHLEVDTLKVRKKATFDTLEIKHVAHVGGEIIISPAGATIESVENTASGNFKCYIKTTDSEGNTIENQFAEDDLVMCKTFNVKKVDENGNATVNNTYYWRKCIGVGESYIILSDAEKEKDRVSDEPKAGDVIVTVGNTDVSERQNAIVLSSYASTAPSIVLYKGINTFELTEKKAPVIISPEKNKFTGDVFISNMDQFNQTFVEILENLISLQVLGVSYEEILGSNAVIESEKSADGKSITFTLNPEIYKIWSKGDAIANILRFGQEVVDKKEEITTTIKVEQIEPSDKKYFEDIEINPEEIDLKLSKTSTLLENPSAESFKIKVSNDEGYLPWTLEVRSSFIKELKSRTGIDIENGQIILQADNTRIDTSDGKTLAEFTEDSIKLNTYQGVSSPVNGREAVKTISEDGNIIHLDGEVVGSWEKDDTIQVELKLAEMPENNLISLEWANIGGVFGDSKPIDIKLKNLFTGTLEYSCKQSVRGLQNPQLKVNYGKVESATIRRTMKYDLKRTGIDIDEGKIILQADGTRINTSDGDTLAEFTENAIRLNTYEGVYIDENGVDAVSEYSFNKDENICIIRLNDGVVQTWQKDDVIEVNLKLKEVPKKNTIKLTWYNVDNKFNVEELILTDVDRIYPGPKSFKCSTSTTNFSNSALLVEGSDVEIATVKRTLKYDLKQTGIDIEGGIITLSADTTMIKDGDDELSLAQFTKNNINFSVYDSIYEDLYGEDVVASISNVDGGKSITLNWDKVNGWKKGDLFNIYLGYNNFKISDKELKIFSYNNNENKFFDNITILGNQLDKVVSKTLELSRDLKSGDKIILEGEYLPDEIYVRSVLKQDLRRTGIDITNGLIVLQADETRINTSNGDTLADFTDNKIALGLKDVNKDLGTINNTLIEIQNGQIILDSDKTQVIDTEYDYPVTLAEFTRDQINLNVYEPYGEIFGDDAVAEYEKEGNRASVTLDSDITKNWKANDIISIKLKYNKFTAEERKDVSISDSAGTFTQFDIPQKEIYSETIRTFTITSTPNIIVIGSENLPDEVQVRRVFPDGLKRTGIDIENGRITLDAGTTVIKDGGEDLTLAEFTKEQIELNTYNNENYYTYGKNAVLEIDNTDNYSTIKLNHQTIIEEGWTKDDVIDIVIETTLELTQDVNVSSYGLVPFDDTTILIQPGSKIANTHVILVGNYVGEFPEGDGPIISFNFGKSNGIVTAKVRRATLESKLNKTGIDIKDGQITLDAKGTYIKTGDGEVTLAKFTQDQINLGVQGEVFDYAYEEDAIYSISEPTISGDYTVNFKSSVAKEWKYGDVVQLTINFIDPVTDIISIVPTGPFGVQNGNIVIEGIWDEQLESANKVQIPLVIKSNPGTIGDVEEYFEGLILMFNAHSQSIISSIEARREILTSEFKKTSIDIQNGKITLDADNTTIKDTDLTLAQFTKDQASISVYETIYNRVDGANAVTDTVTSGNNYQVFSLNKDIINLWKIGNVVEFTLSLTEPLNANQTITVVGINGLQNAIDSKTIPNTLFVNNIAKWTTKLNMSISDIGSLQNPAIRVALSNNSRINCTLTAKCSLKQDLKRTGIDIESGLITLDADKTLIKNSDQTIAEFTSDRISLNVFGKNLINNIPIHEASNKNSLYYGDYNVYDIDYAKTIKVGDVLQYSFVIIPKENVSEVTLSGSNAFIQMFGSTTISKSLTKNNRHTISGTIQCKKSYSDALSAVGATGMYAKIYTSVNNSQGELYIGQVQGLKRTGIDIESGQITLDSERTLIKNGDTNIALFSTDENGKAFIRTELIDADSISANQLETKGTINEDAQKTNFINISNNSMVVFDDSGEAKTIIHSGALTSKSDGSFSGSPYTESTIKLSQSYEIIALTSPITTIFETNYSYLEELGITISKFRATQGSPSEKLADINFTPYLYTIDEETGIHTRLHTFGNYVIYHNEIAEDGYTGSIKFSGRTPLQPGTTYYLALKVEKTINDDYEYIITTSGDGYFVVKKILAVTEIASDGYNFNFSDHGYQNADQSGFITAFGDYGLKIDRTGIFITKNASGGTPKWYNLFERLGIN